jgi:hypothetical protein
MHLRSASLLALAAAPALALPTLLSQEPAADPGAPTIAVAAMLEGVWSERRSAGDPLDGAARSLVEELWSAPAGNNVVGAFRWLDPDGRASMFELLTITAEPDGVYLRLRHFGSDLTAWEEPEEPKTLRLTEHGPTQLVFTAHAHAGDLAAVTYDRSTTDVLAIEVTFDAALGRPPLEFRLERAP